MSLINCLSYSGDVAVVLCGMIDQFIKTSCY